MKRFSLMVLALCVMSASNAAERKSSYFVLETHLITIPHAQKIVEVSFKLDTATGKMWRLSDGNYQEIVIEGSLTPDGRREQKKRRKKNELAIEAVTKKMQKIIIPKLEFRQANIQDVVEFLVAASIDHDLDGKGVNMLLEINNTESEDDDPFVAADDDPFAAMGDEDTGSADENLITFNARSISLLETLRIISEIIEFKMVIDDKGVRLIDREGPANVVFRKYKLMPHATAHMDKFLKSTEGSDRVSVASSWNWADFFWELGVKWPEGSSVKFIPGTGVLFVTNTPENFEHLELIIKVINSAPNMPGRYKLRSVNDAGVGKNSLLLFDAGSGDTWKYKITGVDEKGVWADRFEFLHEDGSVVSERK